MIYLIDYENVHNDGMEGYEYLTEADSLYIFYSKAAPNIRKKIAAKIFDSSMEVHLYKLFEPRKNAIDYYIAAKTGQLVERFRPDRLAIVTKDQGFQSIADFWGHAAEDKCKIILEKNIAECILKAKTRDGQFDTVQYDYMQVPLEMSFHEYEKKKELKGKVKEQLLGTEFENEEDKVIDLFSEAESRKVLYLTTLKQFGRERGTRLYANIKDIKEYG